MIECPRAWFDALMSSGLIGAFSCQECGKKMLVANDKCGECWSRAPQMRNCVDCGVVISAKFKRCNACGEVADRNSGKHPCADCPTMVGRIAKRCGRCSQAYRHRDYLCVDCGIPICRQSKRCVRCAPLAKVAA
jgi:hypothetical protein